jgi:hypothetical protein
MGQITNDFTGDDMTPELQAAVKRWSDPNPADAYPWPCDMHEQPAQRSTDAAMIARAYLAEHPSGVASPILANSELRSACDRLLMRHFHEDEPSPLMQPEEDDHIRDDVIAVAEALREYLKCQCTCECDY